MRGYGVRQVEELSKARLVMQLPATSCSTDKLRIYSFRLQVALAETKRRRRRLQSSRSRKSEP